MLNQSEKLQQIKLYFIFIHTDGMPSEAQMMNLNKIITEANLDNSTMQEYQEFSRQEPLRLKYSITRASTVIAEINTVLGEKCTSMYASAIDTDKTVQAQTMWTLINFGYADNCFSEAEKTVVNYMVERWDFDPLVFAEFCDTAETLAALTQQKRWVETLSKPYIEIFNITQELDRNIASMIENVKTSISEIEII